MANLSDIREHMEVIGADGVHVGTVDRSRMGGSSSPRPTRPAAAMRGITTMCSASSSPPSRATRCGCRPMPRTPSCSRKKKTARRGTEGPQVPQSSPPSLNPPARHQRYPRWSLAPRIFSCPTPRPTPRLSASDVHATLPHGPRKNSEQFRLSPGDGRFICGLPAWSNPRRNRPTTPRIPKPMAVGRVRSILRVRSGLAPLAIRAAPGVGQPLAHQLRAERSAVAGDDAELAARSGPRRARRARARTGRH